MNYALSRSRTRRTKFSWSCEPVELRKTGSFGFGLVSFAFGL